MSVAPLDVFDSRTPACTDACLPRRHDAEAHERFGFLRGLLVATVTPPATEVRTGPLTVRLTDGAVFVHGQEAALSQRERDLLFYLAERVGQWCPTSEIVATVWGPAWLGGRTGRARQQRADVGILTSCLVRLRARLGDAGTLIETASNRDQQRRLVWVEAQP